MIESLKSVMVHAGATWVLWLLIALSVLTVTIAIDRLLYFWSRRENVAALMSELQVMLALGDVEQAVARVGSSRSVEASVVGSGLARWSKGPTAVKEAMAAASGRERARLERRLGFLGTVGNNAPFVGLLGTVIGVVGAFEAMGHGTGGEATLAPERVMGSIAEALVATAVGLLVAIPAVAVFNYFQGKVLVTMEGADTLGHVLLSYLGDPREGAAPDELATALRRDGV